MTDLHETTFLKQIRKPRKRSLERGNEDRNGSCENERKRRGSRLEQSWDVKKDVGAHSSAVTKRVDQDIKIDLEVEKVAEAGELHGNDVDMRVQVVKLGRGKENVHEPEELPDMSGKSDSKRHSTALTHACLLNAASEEEQQLDMRPTFSGDGTTTVQVDGRGWEHDCSAKILRLDNEQMTERDMDFLDSGTWLNDAVINFTIKLAELIMTPEFVHLPDNFFSFSSHFWDRLTMESVEHGTGRVKTGHENVMNWTKKLREKEVGDGIFSRKYICVPVNELQKHWLLAILIDPGHGSPGSSDCHFLHDLDCPRSEVRRESQETGQAGPDVEASRDDKENGGHSRDPRAHHGPYILLLDSAGRNTRKRQRQYESIADKLKDYMIKEWAHMGKCPDEFQQESIEVVVVDVPKQENTFDCGLFVIEYLLRFMSNPNLLYRILRPGDTTQEFAFSQEDVTRRRKDLRKVSRAMFKAAKRGDGIWDVRELLKKYPTLKTKLLEMYTRK